MLTYIWDILIATLFSTKEIQHNGKGMVGGIIYVFWFVPELRASICFRIYNFFFGSFVAFFLLLLPYINT